jgi:ribonuclease P protein component
LKNAAQFQAVYQTGVKKISQSFVLFVRANGLEDSRFGLTTPRRLGKAHERNRVRRRIREILRTSFDEIPRGFDVVINPRRSAHDRNFDDLRTELISLLRAAP